MNKQKSLKRNLLILLLTLLMLATVTVAWFINWAAPFADMLSFDSASLNIDVTITDESGGPLPNVGGNAIMRAENLKPGDTLNYWITIVNRGSACRVYLGLADIKNYFWDQTANAYAEVTPDSAEGRLSEVLKASLLQAAPDSGGSLTELETKIIGDKTKFSFENYIDIAKDETVKLQYRVEFAGTESPTDAPETASGAAAGNKYTLKKTEGMFEVNATLAR